MTTSDCHIDRRRFSLRHLTVALSHMHTHVPCHASHFIMGDRVMEDWSVIRMCVCTLTHYVDYTRARAARER